MAKPLSGRWVLCAMVLAMAYPRAGGATPTQPAAVVAPVGAAAPLQLTDQRGRTLRWDHPPQRIVSLLPALTETVCALGGCARLVGVDRYSNWPAEVRQLPRLGGGLDPSIEAIMAQRPDVVLMARSARGLDALERLGVKVLVLEPQSHRDVQQTLQTVGQLLGQAGAAHRVWTEINQRLDRAAVDLAQRGAAPSVFFEVGSGPYAAGPDSFIGQTLQRLGVRNVVPPGLGPFPLLSPEWVVRANPDVIMASQAQWNEMASRPGWSLTRAVREKRVCLFSPEEADTLVRPGPRMGEAADTMARCLKVHAP